MNSIAPSRWRGIACMISLAVACLQANLSGKAGVATPLANQAPPAAASKMPPPSDPRNPEMKVGIVQRFGSKPEDKLAIEAPPGDRLTLHLKRDDGKPEVITTDRLTLEIQLQPRPKPELYERLVLSTHRSFESAEASANQWRARGLEVEIAQPETWQVWAKRDVYSTPLLRRLLLDDLRKQGLSLPYLDSSLREKAPQASILANYYRYNRNEVDMVSSSGKIRVNGVTYPGRLRLQPNAYGTYSLVNTVTVEDYLRGVVPHEIGPAAPQTAVEAQAILARTYALRNLRRFAVDDYEMCATTQCQVYFGWKETVPRADQAIAATRGLVLTYNDELIDAVYSSTTGGVTAAFTDVWEGAPRPYLQPVVDSVGAGVWDLASRSLATEANFRQFIQTKQGFNEVGWNYFRWTTKSTLAELKQELKTYLTGKQHPLAGFEKVLSLQVLERAPGGRIQTLQVLTDQGEVRLSKDEIIRALEAPNSLLFYLEPILGSDRQLSGYQFIGGGLGHGVGMSQTGSYNLARQGWSSRKILEFYYLGAQLRPLDATVTYWREPAPVINPMPASDPAPSPIPFGSPIPPNP